MTVVLLAGVLSCVWLGSSCRDRSAVEKAQGIVRTNTVEIWRTNVVERWRTNVVQTPVEVWRTNTVVQTVTNEVVKEVPARLTVAEREALNAGYRFLHAPRLDNAWEVLYKAGPFAVDVKLNESATGVLTADDATALKAAVEAALRSRQIPVAAQSPYLLGTQITLVWTTDLPRVVDFRLDLALKETVVVRRQAELLQSSGVVWSTTRRRLVGTDNLPETVKRLVLDQLETFCAEYLKAQADGKQIESRLPSVPSGLGSPP